MMSGLCQTGLEWHGRGRYKFVVWLLRHTKKEIVADNRALILAFAVLLRLACGKRVTMDNKGSEFTAISEVWMRDCKRKTMLDKCSQMLGVCPNRHGLAWVLPVTSRREEQGHGRAVALSDLSLMTAVLEPFYYLRLLSCLPQPQQVTVGVSFTSGVQQNGEWL